MRTRVSAKRRLDRKYPPSEAATPSDYIHHFDDLDATEVILFCRVSGREQNRNGNLADQINENRRELEKLGVTVIERYKEIESGWDNDHWMDRGALAAAAAHAKRLGVVLVAESLSRFIRSVDYHPSKNSHAVPTRAEFEKLLRITEGVTLATIAHPDTPPTAERGVQSKRGMIQKNRMGGRPRKRTRTIRPLETIQQAMELRAAGWSLGEIAKALKVPRPTVQSWADRYLNRGV